jgi:hypothetical protein
VHARKILLLAATTAALAACSNDITAPPTGVASVASRASLTGTVTVSDDFSGASIDGSKWNVVLGIPQGGDGASIVSGAVELSNRAHLNSVQSFDPASGAVHVTGEWTIAGAGDDVIQILTRSSGTPAGPWGETSSGIVFIACSSHIGECPSHMGIGGNGVGANSSTGSLSIDPGVTFLFDVTDDGNNLSFTLTNKANPSQTRTITAASSYVSSSNLVTFHNREACCGGWHVARIDNVSISATTTITVAQALTNLADLINGLGLTASQAAGFTDKITAAQNSLATGKNKTAKNQLNALLNHISAQSGKAITAAQAAALTAAVNAIIAEIP